MPTPLWNLASVFRPGQDVTLELTAQATDPGESNMTHGKFVDRDASGILISIGEIPDADCLYYFPWTSLQCVTVAHLPLEGEGDE